MSAKSNFHAAIEACKDANPSVENDADGNPIPTPGRIACDKAAKDAYDAAKAADPTA